MPRVVARRSAVGGVTGAGDDSASRLVEAIQAGNREAVRALLQGPAEVNATEADGTTPLHWAVRADDLETSTALLRPAPSANAANRYGMTPLSLAAVNGSAAMIEALLWRPAPIPTASSRGARPC